MPTLQQLADLLQVPCTEGAGLELTGVNSLERARPGDLSILAADRYRSQFRSTRASAVLIDKKIHVPPRQGIYLLPVDDADLALAQVLDVMAPPIPQPPVGVHPSSVVSPDATVPDDAAVDSHVSIGARTVIGRRCRIHPGVVISSDVTIGDDVTIYPNVVIRERVRIGHRVIINAGSVIGTDGFGYRWDGRAHVKIPQIGEVVIEDDVEIGSCVCIDRAKFDETRIGRGTKIDNQVQVAHNVRIGMHSILCGQVGIAGTASIGNGVVLGGATVVRDHVTIGDGATAAGNSAIWDNVPPKTTYSGSPALPHRQALREQAAFRRLPELLVEVRQLQEQVKRLRAEKEQTV